MKTFNSRLKVIYGSDDLSNSLSDFNLDTETITLADTEYIYISNLHRFNHVFVAVQTGNTIAAEMTVEAYANGE